MTYYWASVHCGDLQSPAKRLSAGAVRVDHEAAPGLEGFDYQSAGVAADGDGAVWPGAEECSTHRTIGLCWAGGAVRRSLAGDDNLRLRPSGQLRCVRKSAAVMRSHEDVGVHG